MLPSNRQSSINIEKDLIMKDDLDLKDFILKSINTFTFENFDFGKKWIQR